MPKGVPLETGQRNLAVHVEDHPLDYAGFEGEIPKGQYGAGTVEIWDSGTYELLEEKPDGGLTVRLDGERLQGVWTLVPAHLSGEEKNWLILRKRDDAPPKSRGKRAEYAPMLATLAEDVPPGKGWSFEVKFDGYRALAYVRGSEARLVSRNGNDLTARFENVGRALSSAIKTPDCVLDGEVCALDEEGRSSFSAMQQGSGAIVYYVFDVLEVEGTPVVDRPLEERRKELVRLLDRRNRTVLLSEAFDDGPGLKKAAAAQNLEGIVAKKAGSRYEPGRRSRNWLKIKAHGRQEFIVAGYTRGKGRRSGTLGSLVLAVSGENGLEYVGNVGTGFTEKEIDKLLKKLRPLERRELAVRLRPEDAEGAPRRHRLGRAEARLRGRVRRVDARRPAARALLQGPPRGQGGRGGAPRAADRDRDPARQARPQALEPRQGLLPGERSHEGRPARLLPRCRAGCSSRI